MTAVGGTTLNLDSASNRVGRDRVERRRQRLLRVRGEAVLAARHGCAAARSPTSRRTPTRHRRGDLRLDVLPGQKGWFRVGGTSLSAPLIAAVYALAGNGSSTSAGSFPYAHTSRSST